MRQLDSHIFANRPLSPLVAYWRDSTQPLTTLVFLSPIFLIYHCGLWLLSREELHLANGADLLIAKILNVLFLAGIWLVRAINPEWVDSDLVTRILRGGSSFASLALLVSGLLILHYWNENRWRFRFYLLVLMAAESILLALPVFILEWLVRYFGNLENPETLLNVLVGADGKLTALAVGLIMSTGAGIYEEFLFRGLLMTGMFFLAGKIFARKNMVIYCFIMLVQAAAFAGFHYLPGVTEHFYWSSFIFRLAAGLYFGYWWQERGFAITAGSHIAYDLLAVTAKAMAN